MHGRLKELLVAATALGFLTVPSQVGTAAAEGSTAAVPARGEVCVSEAVPAGSVERPSAPVCFGSFSAAISHATDGAVQLPAGATRITQAQLDRGAARADVGIQSVVIGVSQDSNDCCYAARTWVHTASSGCDGDDGWEWQINYVGNSWNDDIDSATGGYSGCEGKYWEHANFGGAAVMTNWSGGPMEDETSSITFH